MSDSRFQMELAGATRSRRQVLALMLGAPTLATAFQNGAPLRFAISETVLGEVNMNDVRPAMQFWIERMNRELSVVIDPNVVNTTQEIQDRVRKGQIDAVALSINEYRAIAEFLDSSQIITSAGVAGQDQYVILAHRNSGIRQLGDLKGRRLSMYRNPKMCVASVWLYTILEEGRYSPAEQFFASMASDVKLARVVLPVFFGQADACLTTRRGFETMCELNPQVARDLKEVVSSPLIVVSFYVFRKNYQSPNREKLTRSLLSMRASPAGGQLAALFQFEDLAIRDASCLASALAVLEAADRARARRGGRKG